jgi:hypothetical protein
LIFSHAIWLSVGPGTTMPERTAHGYIFSKLKLCSCYCCVCLYKSSQKFLIYIKERNFIDTIQACQQKKHKILRRCQFPDLSIPYREHRRTKRIVSRDKSRPELRRKTLKNRYKKQVKACQNVSKYVNRNSRQ